MKDSLIKLILAGEDLVDGAETCGHDDSVDEWIKSVASIKKKYKITDSDISKYRAGEDAKENKKELKKKENLLKQMEDKRLKDADFLKEFGIVQTNNKTNN